MSRMKIKSKEKKANPKKAKRKEQKEFWEAANKLDALAKLARERRQLTKEQAK